MRRIVLLATIAAVLLGFYGLRAVLYARDLQRLGAMVSADVALTGLSDFDQATVIRGHIYQSVRLATAPTGYDFGRVDLLYTDATGGRIGLLCGGLSVLYASALESQGIPARYVSLWTTDATDGHTSVEFWNGRQWVASDPSFNVAFRYGGRFLSWSEVWYLVLAGEQPEFVGDQQPGRRIEDYYLPFNALVQNVSIQPVIATGRYYPTERYPAGWDRAAMRDQDDLLRIVTRGLIR